MATSELLPTPQAIDFGPPRELRLKTGKRNPKKLGNYRGDLKDHISLLADSPANHSPKPDEERERQMTATSGRKCYELYGSFIHAGLSVKTLAALLLGTKVWFSNKCTLTWKVKVTKSKRLLFQLFPSTRRTEGTESGLLRTPNTMQRGTPSAAGLTRGHQLELQDQIRILPTPNARDTRGKSIKRDRVPDIVEGHNRPIGQQTGLKLQPAFVEWMMGYPEGWTEIPDSKLLEMRLSRKSQKKSLK